MEIVGGNTFQGKKKRWSLVKLKEKLMDLASSPATSYRDVAARHFMPPSKKYPLWTATKDANISYARTDDGDIAAGKVEKLGLKELTMQMDKPGHEPSWFAPKRPVSDVSWLSQSALQGAWFQMSLSHSAAWPCLPGSQPIRPIVNGTLESTTWSASGHPGSQPNRTIVSDKLHLPTVISNLRELRNQHGFSPSSCIGSGKDDFGSPVATHMRSSDSRNFGMDEASSVCEDRGKRVIPDEYPYEFYHKRQRTKKLIRVDDRNKYLLRKDLNRLQVVLTILHMARVREFTDYDPKQYTCVPYRFYECNMAFFDLDKESEEEHGPLYHHHSEFDYEQLDQSINVISIKVTESDVSYPINIYGTVLARDQYDYRSVYLFKRGRDDSQLISSPDDMLTLTGPYRALAGMRSMYFEFNLKIKVEGTDDQDFSKGWVERNLCAERFKLNTLSIDSYLSTVEVLYMPVLFALEASIEVNTFLDGKFNFMGKIAAWTTTTEESKIILYDSEVTGTETKLGNDGAVSLTRHVVAVPQKECLVIDVSFYDGNCRSESHKFFIENSIRVLTCEVGPYELEFKIIWKEIRKRQPDLWRRFGGIKVLYGNEAT